MNRTALIRGTVIIVLLAFVITFMPTASRAAVKKYWPDKFTKTWSYFGFTNRYHVQNPGLASFDSGLVVPLENWRGWVEVKLPVGKKITKTVLYYKNLSGNYTRLSLYRVKMGELPDILAGGGSNDTFPAPTEEEIPLLAGKDKVVRKGYRYYLVAECEANSAFYGAKVFYK